jgi:hypothetical protein
VERGQVFNKQTKGDKMIIITEVIYVAYGKLGQKAFASEESYLEWLEYYEPDRLAGNFEILKMIDSEL